MKKKIENKTIDLLIFHYFIIRNFDFRIFQIDNVWKFPNCEFLDFIV